jgi:hypothetical protein
LTLATGRVCVALFTDIEIVQRAVLRQTFLNEACAKKLAWFFHTRRISIDLTIAVFTTSGDVDTKEKEIY